MGPFLLALSLLAQNPAWPPENPDPSPEALADPASWPGDPDFGPRLVGDDCQGQLELLGYTPDCTPLVRDEERAFGAGIGADRAWAVTAGQPAITLALVGDGVDLGHPDLVARWALNPAELPFPDTGIPTSRHDLDGDGAFTVLDFTSATGTVPPTLDRVLDRRLLERADRGDTNGNGLLDPQDILRIFSNGRDEDGNGYVDDIVGWDFLEDDNDPSAPLFSSHGTDEALAAVATANNGVGGAGVCPRCTALPVRLSGQGLAGADRGAFALLYASGRRARAVLVTPALLGAGPHLAEALALTETRGSAVIAAAGTGESRLAHTAWPGGAVLVVGSVGHDRAARARATSQVAPDPCARFGAPVDVVAPGRCDDLPAARVAGVAGLVLSAALGEDRGLGPLEPGLMPGELLSVLRAATVDLGAPGWDEATAWGRIDARRAVDLVVQRRVPAPGSIRNPTFGEVLDPSAGTPADVELFGSRSRHARVRWTLRAALGAAPPPEAFVEVESGVFAAGEDRVAHAAVPLDGLRSDPTSPLASEFTLQVSFQAEGETEDAPASVARRVVHVHRDLEVMPAFPVALGAGNVGGARAVPLEVGAPNTILVGTTDGRVRAIDARGEDLAGFTAASPPLELTGVSGHAVLPELLDGAVTERRAPLLAPLSVTGEGADTRIVTVSAEGHVIAFGPRGAVRAGFPLRIRDSLARARAAPAGVTAAVATLRKGEAVSLWASDGEAALVELDAEGEVRARYALDGPPGAAAVHDDGSLWVSTPAQVFHFAAGVTAATSGWPQPLLALASPRGLLAASIPAPVLTALDDRNFAFIAPWGGRISRLSAGEGVQRFDVIAWHPSLALADLEVDGARTLVATLAPERQVQGLLPAEAPEDARAAVELLDGGVTTAFVGSGAGTFSEPLIVDVGGDEAPEVVFGDDAGRLWAVGADGRVAARFPKVTGDPILGAPTVGDIDGDGRLELIAVTRRGRLWAWRLPTSRRAPVPWNGARAGPSSRADADATTAAVARNDGCRCVGTRPARATGLIALLCLVFRFGRRRSAR